MDIGGKTWHRSRVQAFRSTKLRKQRKLKRYSPQTYKNWVAASPEFTESSLLIKSYQVMQRWEDGYMKSLAAIVTARGGDILEVGLGLGISARYIQRSSDLWSHTIIECHPQVVDFGKKLFAREIGFGQLRILQGFWEDLTPGLPTESFDGILFDSCPLNKPVELFQFFNFFPEAHRLLRPGGVFTYFSDEPKIISRKHGKALQLAGFKKVEYKLCKVHPPKDCQYWKYPSIVTPVIRK